MSHNARINISIAVVIITLFLGSRVIAYAAKSAAISPEKTLNYREVFSTHLEGEEVTEPTNKILVHAFDLKRNGKRNGIVVAGKKLYIFSGRGTLLNTPAPTFTHDVQQIRIARLSKEGYYDGIVVSYHTCGPKYMIFDRTGLHVATIDASSAHNVISCFVRDLNGDGIDEIVVDGGAYGTKDGWLSWKLLWEDEKLTHRWTEQGQLIGMWLGSSLGKDGFCGQYTNTIFALSGDGKRIFSTPIQMPDITDWNTTAVPLTSGDFNGDGLKESVVCANGTASSSAYIIDERGKVVRDILNEVNGTRVPILTIRCGKMSRGENDKIVIGGRNAVTAYDPTGKPLWGFGVTGDVDHLFITDLDGDGISEIIAATDKTIYIISNKGKKLQAINVRGELKGAGWHSYNPAMDIADINDDGKKEIIAVTTAGDLFIFGAAAER